jgi:ubiquinone/menaquinone biosynthesis C-methylase UbiE
MHTILPRRFSEHEVRDDYAKVAWFYNLWSRLTESKAARVELQLAGIKDGEQVLEVAVGTGRVFSEIVRRNGAGHSEGIDLSESMLRRARHVMRAVPHDRYELRTGSAYKLPFESHTFDLLVNNFMLDLLPAEDFATILSEFRRVLKPEGRIVLSTMTFGRAWYNRIWDWIATHIPSLLTGCRPVAMTPYLDRAGFDAVASKYISQNTFPAEVILARPRGIA